MSCSLDKPTIDYKEGIDTTSVVDDRVKDTTKILVAELPVKFDSKDIRLFAIKLVELQEGGGYSKYGSGSYRESGLVGSYQNRDDFMGDFINLIFQDKEGNDRKLTDKKMAIRRYNSFARFSSSQNQLICCTPFPTGIRIMINN